MSPRLALLWPVQKILIALFCLWHCFAVSMYLLTNDHPEIFWSARRVISPYILGLSQWQKWDIFSPDPLRRVDRYTIDVWEMNRWKPIQLLNFDHFAWQERSKEIKILERMHDAWDDIIPAYVSYFCDLDAAKNRTIRLTAYSHILPDSLRSLSRLQGATLHETEKVLGSTRCPTL